MPAACVLITRSDGEKRAFTSYQEELTVGSDVYEPNSNLDASTIASKLNTGVSNFDVFGAVHTDTIEAEDLFNGLYDGAEVLTFMVHGPDVSLGSFIVHRGYIGEIEFGDDTHRVEVLGLSTRLKQKVIRTVLPACDALLGDSRCTVDLNGNGVNGDPLRAAGTVTVVGVGQSRVFTANLDQVYDDGWFDNGKVTFSSGDNNGLSMEVKTSTYSGSGVAHIFTLQLPMPHLDLLTHTFEAEAGCLKRFTEDCVGKFDNALNFRGFPHLPGLNQITKVGR